MQVIGASRPGSFSDRFIMARSALVAVLLLMAGASLGWVALGTSLVSGFIPYGRPDALEMAGGVLVWGFAVVVPAAFLILGVVRLASVLEAVSASRPRRVTSQLGSALDSDHLAATDLVLPGGRRIHELVLGPFGIAVLGAAPPPSISRHVGIRWEFRDERGRWIPIEDPVQRTSRDAERVRGWLGTDERDFLVRVYAAIVTDDERVERSPRCAVVAPRDLAGWLEALPAQRGLSAERRGHLAQLLRSVARSA